MEQLFSSDATVRRLSLVRLSAEIARSVAVIGRVVVEGEVVKPAVRPSGRIFFVLRDRAAQVNVVCPPSRARRCRVVHGERVEVTATLTWATDRGSLHLVAEEVVPVGAGAIAAALEDTRRRLAADGLLTRPRRAVPRLPRLIGVVCGSDAAVRADIESVVAARFPGYPLLFQEATVTGPGAAQSILAGLRALEARPDVDVVILARGGGDASALFPFSDEELCRAMCASAKPVVSAIGHDRDRPLCDEVADLRCGTPSLAATAVVPDRAVLQAELDAWLAEGGRSFGARLDAAERAFARVDRAVALRAGVATAERRLERAASRLGAVEPGRRVSEAARALAGVDWQGPASRRLSAASSDLAGRRHTVEALDPARVLGRGYAVVRGPGGGVLRDPGAVVAGDVLGVTLARGGLLAAVLEEEAAEGRAAGRA